jgi:hypothetical protein
MSDRLEWKRGDRVWYEPSCYGIRFAGVVVGHSDQNGLYRVFLSREYSLLKDRALDNYHAFTGPDTITARASDDDCPVDSEWSTREVGNE